MAQYDRNILLRGTAYDANFNITHLQRSSNQASTLMDDLTYHYQSGTNRLDHVRDFVSDDSFVTGFVIETRRHARLYDVI